MCVGFWAGVTYLRYTVLMSSNRDETAVQCSDPALSVLVMFGVPKRLSRSIPVFSLLPACPRLSRSRALHEEGRRRHWKGLRLSIWLLLVTEYLAIIE